MGLTKITYFYPETIRSIVSTRVQRVCGSGPMEKFNEMQALLPDVPPSSDRGGGTPSTA